MHRNLTGNKFGKLLVIRETQPRSSKNIKWDCVCDCGSHGSFFGSGLVAGGIQSCGCSRKKPRPHRVKHGKSGSREYRIWNGMMRRCHDPKNAAYERYGGRGIEVCEEWRNFATFLADMQPFPEGLTLERKNNDGPYAPWNCVWASAYEQSNNRRNNIKLSAHGKRQNVSQWAAELGVKPKTIYARLKRGHGADKALSV